MTIKHRSKLKLTIIMPPSDGAIAQRYGAEVASEPTTLAAQERGSRSETAQADNGELNHREH